MTIKFIGTVGVWLCVCLASVDQQSRVSIAVAAGGWSGFTVDKMVIDPLGNQAACFGHGCFRMMDAIERGAGSKCGKIIGPVRAKIAIGGDDSALAPTGDPAQVWFRQENGGRFGRAHNRSMRRKAVSRAGHWWRLNRANSIYADQRGDRRGTNRKIYRHPNFSEHRIEPEA